MVILLLNIDFSILRNLILSLVEITGSCSSRVLCLILQDHYQDPTVRVQVLSFPSAFPFQLIKVGMLSYLIDYFIHCLISFSTAIIQNATNKQLLRCFLYMLFCFLTLVYENRDCIFEWCYLFRFN